MTPSFEKLRGDKAMTDGSDMIIFDAFLRFRVMHAHDDNPSSVVLRK